MGSLPPYISRERIRERLPLIFPEGKPNRSYCIRELAASTVFAALYIGAVEGSDRYLAPVHVYRMTVKQAAKSDKAEREKYADGVLKKKFRVSGARWYADNTREPIRDETLRDGLVAVGAVLRREDLPTTSGNPRYTLKRDFAVLFDPTVEGAPLEQAITAFQVKHLTKSALARTSIIRAGAVATEGGLVVAFPNGETRKLAPGPSSIISKAVIERFTKLFLTSPAVLWLSESGNKVVARDDRLAEAIGLKIQPDKHLPDIILADLGPTEPLIIFVEVVATDGAITAGRQAAMYALTDAAGFDRSQVAFLSAYLDRESAGFRKTISGVAWNSFAWLVSEPEHIIIFRDGQSSPAQLSELLAVHPPKSGSG